MRAEYDLTSSCHERYISYNVSDVLGKFKHFLYEISLSQDNVTNYYEP